MDSMEELTSGTFESATGKGLCVVDFWAPWCGPCKAQAPIFEAASKEHDQVKFCKVNVDEEPRLASQVDVRGIPTLIFLKDGEIIDKHAGILTKAKLDEKIKRHL